MSWPDPSSRSHRDLLPAARHRQQGTRVVVITRTGEWEQYLEAMRLGAFDFIRGPMHPTDVELGGPASATRAERARGIGYRVADGPYRPEVG